MDDDTDMGPLATAVGTLVLVWGGAEAVLEGIVFIVFESYNGKKLTRQIPTQLAQKITYIRKCATHLPAIKFASKDMLKLMDKFDELSETRHNFIHGAIRDFNTENGIAKFTRMRTRRNITMPEKHEIDFKKFPEILDKFSDLHVSANSLFEKLHLNSPKLH